ncbi:hypothetical protein BS47DRAFT_1357465 [Hydnum rufescens UP504]|uniref:Uncharacterized protein n=1 Tax=Hydnum rufescens UP504 TaxID=1448309 RepID=A0A9P6DZL5_9AGAM|nr:hypothetical protein BS47DRAFT_1357465 [Hydnum rufescens UP504]
MMVSECMPNSEKQLQLWGFECLKDNQIKWFLTMMRRGNSTKSMAAIARDPEDQECLCQDIGWLHSRVYQRPSSLASNPVAFPKWSLWMTGKELPHVCPIEMLNSKWKAIESVEKDSTAKHVWSEGELPATNVASAESSSTDLASAATQLRFPKFQKKHWDPLVLVWSNGGSDASMKGTIDGICTHHLPQQYFIP